MDESISLIDQEKADKNRSGVPIHVVAAIFFVWPNPHTSQKTQLVDIHCPPREGESPKNRCSFRTLLSLFEHSTEP